MPRPTRIEYEGAFHHVMNQGRNRSKIFLNDSYYQAFLNCMKEASEQFDAVIHAYCLMPNHYHLLIETPKANLARIMRHINGLYTQRYNRLKGADGTLFRGRYKAVLLDDSEYLLQVGRYIHLNPLDAKRSKVKDIADHPWSSYPAYINQADTPSWLSRDNTYDALGLRQRYKGYKAYIQAGIDEEMQRYYGKHNLLSVLGSTDFKKKVKKTFKRSDLEKIQKALENRPCAEEIIRLVSQVTKTPEKDIRAKSSGRQVTRPERAFAMYACRYYGDNSQKEIAKAFGLSHLGSASYSIDKIKKLIAEGQWKKEVKWLEKKLNLSIS